MPDLRQGAWRKSSRSNGQNGACVEVALTAEQTLIRDSKNPAGARLAFGAGSAASFISQIKAGRYDV
ncbi:DUF397 domain-containing protein [Saccharothrix carnea]|nr:DUF397 domain-containing protein [Saccharothrix carnea]